MASLAVVMPLTPGYSSMVVSTVWAEAGEKGAKKFSLGNFLFFSGEKKLDWLVHLTFQRYKIDWLVQNTLEVSKHPFFTRKALWEDIRIKKKKKKIKSDTLIFFKYQIYCFKISHQGRAN